MATVHLFIDTNFLIQCKKYDQIDWDIDELKNADEILLLISRPVLDEIDRQKQDGNSRRARRARKANSLFRQLLDEKELISLVRDKRIITKLAKLHKIADLKEAVPELDVDRNDDELVATAKMYQHENPGLDVRVLTDDTGVAFSATRCNLAYIMVPDDWHLPLEQDEKDKKIAALEERVRVLSQQLPIIEISEVVLSDERPVLLSGLTENIVDELVAYIRQLHPLEAIALDEGLVSRTCTFLRAVHPTAEEISKYDELYENWLLSLRGWLRETYSIIRDREALYALEFTLTNEGGVPVENLVIEMTTHGEIVIAPPTYTESKVAFKLPDTPLPPSPPKTRFVSTLNSGLAGLKPVTAYPLYSSLDPIFAKLGRESSRDRNAFYWKGGKPDRFCEKWILECEEFRHKVASEHFEILIRGDGDADIQGAISIVVSGANLPDPYKRTIPINQSSIRQDPYSVMLSTVKEYFYLGEDQ